MDADVANKSIILLYATVLVEMWQHIVSEYHAASLQ